MKRKDRDQETKAQVTVAKTKLTAVPSEDKELKSGMGVGQVPELQTDTKLFRIISDSPLLMNQFNEKAKEQMLANQTGRVKTRRAPKDPNQLYLDSMHVVSGRPGEPGAVYGIPAGAFKKAMVAAASDTGMKMTEVRRKFFVEGNLVPIESTGPQMREDYVRISGGVCDLRYRAEFLNWRAELTITYNKQLVRPEELVYWLNLAGFGVGVLEHRPQRDGSNGRFHVARGTEWDQWTKDYLEKKAAAK